MKLEFAFAFCIVSALNVVVTAQTPINVHDATNRFLPADINASERKILSFLFESRNLALVDVPLPGFVEFLSKSGVPTYLSKKHLEESGIDQNTTITVQQSSVRLIDVLQTVLHDKDLGWTIDGEWLVITSEVHAEERLVTKFYDVRNLVEFVPTAAKVSRSQGISYQPDFGSLINLITQSIQPASWADAGGPGGIEPYSTRRMRILVISQTFKVHLEIQSLLHRLDQFAGHAPLESPLSTSTTSSIARRPTTSIRSSRLRMTGQSSNDGLQSVAEMVGWWDLPALPSPTPAEMQYRPF